MQTPFEYREAQYATAVERIANVAARFQKSNHPKVVATLVFEHIAQGGAACPRLPSEATQFDCAQRMNADVMAIVDAGRCEPRVAEADHTVRAFQAQVLVAREVSLPCHPQDRVTLERGDREAQCRTCERVYVVEGDRLAAVAA